MNKQNHKRAFILHEAMMAVGIAMVLVVGVTQVLVMVTNQQRLARQYTIATREAGNLMEQVVTQSWEGTTSERLASVTLPETCNQHLPNASLSIEMVEEDTTTRRISIAIEWRSAPERAPDSVQLVGWKFRGQEDES